MRTSFLAFGVVAVLSACGGPTPTNEPCSCVVPTASGTLTLQCGESICLGESPVRCAGPMPSHLETAGRVCPATPMCQPKTCASVGAVCGDVQDGCGGTLQCGTCGSEQRCDANQCVTNPCAQSGRVCGVVNGQSCGECPQGATCTSTGTSCVEKVATLPFDRWVSSAVLSGDTLYASGLPTSGATTKSVVSVTLTDRQVHPLASGLTRLSPLAVNRTHLVWTTTSGVTRLAHGSSTPEPVAGLTTYCDSLLVDDAQLFCGLGGDPRFGVDPYGIKVMPVTGGTPQWLVQFLNYPSLALTQGMLFHVGTTDNQYRFKVLSVTYLNDGSTQTVVSGGALDGHFIMADASSFYFVGDQGQGYALTRVPFDNAPSVDLLQGSGFRMERTQLIDADVWTVVEKDGQGGLYRVPKAGGAATLWVAASDFGGSASGVGALLRHGDDFLVVSGVDLFRLFRP